MSKSTAVKVVRAPTLAERARKLQRSLTDATFELHERVNGLSPSLDRPEAFQLVEASFAAYLTASESVGANEVARHLALEWGQKDPGRAALLQQARALARAHWHTALALALAPPSRVSITELAQIEQQADKAAKQAFMLAVLSLENSISPKSREGFEAGLDDGAEGG